ncbi:helix-turn-helix transcriptional regulator [Halocynthiibacter namhaensis]|uniref:helix-turn-helix transcriptional regulator n=1 Tax=Halocynthiibacter namhaensis TaxID=1290553 RepID=UPI00068BF10C|nr:autoinducer binding domain-containing protein [Halocynthiibacter namhaensis]
MIDKADLDFLTTLAPSGFYLAMRVGFAFPVAEANTLPEGWVSHYTNHGFMMYDPVLKWVYGNTGATRWADIKIPDPRNVLRDAKRHGLDHGVAISCLDDCVDGQRSYGSFARQDRAFSDEEIRILSQVISELHASYSPPKNLTKAELEVLIMIKDGLLMKQIADDLGISLGAVKQRLKNAKYKLHAKTSSHAAALAIQFGLI